MHLNLQFQDKKPKQLFRSYLNTYISPQDGPPLACGKMFDHQMKSFMHRILLEKPQNLVPKTPKIIVCHASFLVSYTKEVVNFSSSCLICPQMLMPTLSIRIPKVAKMSTHVHMLCIQDRKVPSYVDAPSKLAYH